MARFLFRFIGHLRRSRTYSTSTRAMSGRIGNRTCVANNGQGSQRVHGLTLLVFVSAIEGLHPEVQRNRDMVPPFCLPRLHFVLSPPLLDVFRADPHQPRRFSAFCFSPCREGSEVENGGDEVRMHSLLHAHSHTVHTRCTNEGTRTYVGEYKILGRGGDGELEAETPGLEFGDRPRGYAEGTT
ncbi:hypothetical protein F5880DRAFT_1619369 [Lentinula raphanica]|nr:hypothetical protein F5880DRAFT_1619369 [Lentinula raphanica]